MDAIFCSVKSAVYDVIFLWGRLDRKSGASRAGSNVETSNRVNVKNNWWSVHNSQVCDAATEAGVVLTTCHEWRVWQATCKNAKCSNWWRVKKNYRRDSVVVIYRWKHFLVRLTVGHFLLTLPLYSSHHQCTTDLCSQFLNKTKKMCWSLWLVDTIGSLTYLWR